MKIDTNSILYIIIMIIILVVSGLGSRRKKQAQKMNKPFPSSAKPGTQKPEDITLPKPRGPVMDPFDRLEQILTGQTRYDTMEGESLEVLEDEEQAIIDEEAEYLAAQVPQQEVKQPEYTAETEDEQGKKSLGDLFGDVDEVTRAIIYSEILPRKYI